MFLYINSAFFFKILHIILSLSNWSALKTGKVSQVGLIDKLSVVIAVIL